MVKTLIFNSKGMPSRLDSSIKTPKDLHWIHVDEKDDEKVYDMISYELSDLGISHNLSKHPRPSIRYSKKYQIIKLAFPREAGIYIQETENLVVRFLVSKKYIITMSNNSEEINAILNDIYINKKKLSNVSEIFVEILSHLINKSYESLDSIDATLNEIQSNIFANKNKKTNFQKSETMRDNIYHLYAYLIAGNEIFDELRMKRSFIKNDVDLERIRSRFYHIKDIVGGQKESLGHMADVYLGVLSANMGKYMYKLTILGSILLVPAIISGLYGMNIPLPDMGFWSIVGISVALSLASGLFMAWWAKK